jgi:hypothetical protein
MDKNMTTLKNMITLKNLFIFNTLVALAYGLGALFVPALVMSNYGLTLNIAGELMTRFYGAELIAHGWMTWNARNAAASQARTAILSARSIGNTIRSVVAIAFLLSGEGNVRGISIVGIFAFFAIAYAYFWLFKPDAN